MSRIDGRNPNASAQIRTPGCLPVVGRMKDASHVPSGVLIVTLFSATGMFAARAERVAAVAATPAAIDSATKSRREKSSPESRPVGCRSSLIDPPPYLSELFE